MASTKSPWEARVGSLLDPRLHVNFKYSFRPYDSALYGGQPRLDWFATDVIGRFWGIEVKHLPVERKRFDPFKLTSPGQQQALLALSETVAGVSLLAVGHDHVLYVYDWRLLSWLQQVPGAASTPSRPSLVSLGQALFALPWTGPKTWKLVDLFSRYEHQVKTATAALTGPYSGPAPTFGSPSLPTVWTRTSFDPSSSDGPPAPSPSISKQKASTRTRLRKLLSAPSSSR